MPVKPTEKIWHNGKFIPWKDATLHVMSHVVNYGSSVFEGIRCYAQPKGGGAIFRATEHAQRLLDSAKIYRIDVDYTREELVAAMLELVRLNRTVPCYIRPIVLRGYGAAGQFGAARHHPRLGHSHRQRPRNSGDRADDSARNALHRRRSLFLRHGSGNHSGALSG